MMMNTNMIASEMGNNQNLAASAFKGRESMNNGNIQVSALPLSSSQSVPV